MSATALLVLIPAVLAISAILAFCVPVWASLSITLAVVVIVAIGGGELLAKSLIAGAVLAVGVWFTFRHIRRRRMERSTAGMNWVAIPEAKREAPPRAEQRQTERRAA
jgi:hypothetical protein